MRSTRSIYGITRNSFQLLVYDAETINHLCRSNGKQDISVHGRGINDLSEKIIGNPYHKAWSDILKRCYSETWLKDSKNAFDIGNSVCEEWHKYSNFKSWMMHQVGHREGRVLTKSILTPHNKVFSPDFCIFVPRPVKNLFNHGPPRRIDYPMGVFKDGDKFSAQVLKDGKRTNLGRFHSPKTAHAVYMVAKAEIILYTSQKHLTAFPYDERAREALKHLAHTIVTRIAEPDYNPKDEKLW